MDAQDSSGNYVQVTLSADQTEFKNNNASLVLELNLKLWAQAVVSGAERLVIGTKNKKNLLTRVQLLETDEFRATLMKREEMAKCFNFQDRLLTFIKIHLPVSSRHKYFFPLNYFFLQNSFSLKIKKKYLFVIHLFKIQKHIIIY